MKISNHSIGARMATALGLVLALLLGAALFGIATLYRTLGTYDTTVLGRVAQERAVSRMESEFKTQVLEWKNTLLRGEDSRKRELHWNAFQASEKRVADAAKALEPQLTDAQEKAALQKFTQAHAQMAQGYRKGFEVFQSLGFVPSAGDADVADIDQGPAKLLTELSQQVAASSAAIAQEAAQDARRALFSSLVALALVTALGACAGWLLTRSVVRPLGVAISTAGSDLPTKERAFIAWLGPRGIVAAAVASVFAQQLESQGMGVGLELRALVFLLIAVTVSVQGLSSGFLAAALGLRRPQNRGYVVVGANPLGRALGRALKDAGHEVVLIDTNPQEAHAAEERRHQVEPREFARAVERFHGAAGPPQQIHVA